jgi:tRNA threonylcarbamoyl adenosine modification protein (Sua5/YciO/YrdC/YwlC family)
MLIHLHSDTPDQRKINQLVEYLKKGGVIIIPTDTIYALACDLYNRKGIEQICRLLGKKPNKANLSLICRDLSHIAEYTRQIPNPVYKLMKRLLPGPYTFILNANSNVGRLFKGNKKTVGIRVPDNEIVSSLIKSLGNPLVSSSIHSEDEIQEYLTEPEEIDMVWQNRVEYIVDGGAGMNKGSTVLDCTSSEPEVIREGLGFDQL